MRNQPRGPRMRWPVREPRSERDGLSSRWPVGVAAYIVVVSAMLPLLVGLGLWGNQGQRPRLLRPANMALDNITPDDTALDDWIGRTAWAVTVGSPRDPVSPQTPAPEWIGPADSKTTFELVHQSQTVALPPAAPWTASVTSPGPPSDDLQATLIRALRAVERGALDTAEQELWSALGSYASRSPRCESAFRSAIRAMREVEDFVVPNVGPGSDVRSIASRHATRPLGDASWSGPLLRDVAVRSYLEYAREELIAAVGGEPRVARALHGLGRVYRLRAEQDNRTLDSAKAVALHQAAARVDPQDHWAHNDLGVLFARGGCWHDARAHLEQSIRIRPSPEAWNNLAMVHTQQGRTNDAANARAMASRVSAPIMALPSPRIGEAISPGR